MRDILVTGGCGYIGSHTALLLLNSGAQVAVINNLSNSSVNSLQRISELTGSTPEFLQLDIRNLSDLQSLFYEKTFDAVIHFVGLKAVGESVAQPLAYYENNVTTYPLIIAINHAFPICSTSSIRKIIAYYAISGIPSALKQHEF